MSSNLATAAAAGTGTSATGDKPGDAGTGTGAAGAGSTTEGQTDGKDGQDEDRAGGNKAILRDLATERDARQAVQQELSGLKTQFSAMIAALTGKTDAPEGVTAETVAAQLEAWKSEQTAKDKSTQARLARSGVKAQAQALGFHDVTDALARVDIEKVPFTDDGEVDNDYIKAELAKIAEKSPYLVKPASVSAETAGIGAAGSGITDANMTSEQRMAAGYAASGKSRK